jgi:hypothetical protein
VSLKAENVRHRLNHRATVRQSKTALPVRLEITEQMRQAIEEHLASGKRSRDFLFCGRRGKNSCLSTPQYAPVSEWIANIGLDPSLLGTHSLRRTKATLIYRRTGNLRGVPCSLAIPS